MGIQLTGGFLSDNGSEYDIYIYNESFVGSNHDVVTSESKLQMSLDRDWETSC